MLHTETCRGPPAGSNAPALYSAEAFGARASVFGVVNWTDFLKYGRSLSNVYD